MRLPLLWLHDFTVPDADLKTLEDRLTMTGTKVEALHTHGVSALEHFVIAKVLTRERHPDADRLSVCTVDLGDGGPPSQIVCGAPNVDAGQTVAVAKPGSVMPDGTKLKKAKLRGQESNGMILAEDEVAIGTDHDGIMVLSDDLAAGTPLIDVLPIATDVLELEITPNRPDCLSVYGVAREVHAIFGSPLAPAPWTDDRGSEGDVEGVTVEVQDFDLCPRFTLRAFEDVTIGPSPTWLKARLMAAGQRPINNVVDITNYVMLLTGQPLHAFDADKVEGGKLVVRRAKDGEKVTTLDDVERTLDGEMLVIDDAAGPTSIAGVMGGNRSEVSETTTRVFMEAANWNGPNIQRTSGKLALRSEASGRFEKGLSPEQTREGLAVATRLMLELTGARLVPGTIDTRQKGQTLLSLRLREARVERLLGRAIDRATQARILEALGFTVAEAEDGLDVTVPHFRAADVTREVDLIEEVARIDGFDKLPATLPSRQGAVGVLMPEQRLRRRAEDALVGAGLYEVVGWSFTSEAAQARLNTGVEPVRLKNPMSEEQAVMRTSLLTSLLAAAETNARRGTPDVRLFEIGSVYLPWGGTPRVPGRWDPPAGTRGARAWEEQSLPDERTHVGALVAGASRPASWDDSGPRAWSFSAMKGVVEMLGRALRVPMTFAPTTEPFLHPGRAAAISVEKPANSEGFPTQLGWLGELHPSLGGGAAFELDLSVLFAAADAVPTYRDLTSFPALRLDLAVTLSDAVPAQAVVETIQRAGGKLLQSAEVFDVYRGEQVTGKSLAVRLTFRAPDRTLTDDDVAPARAKIVKRLQEDLGGELRG